MLTPYCEFDSLSEDELAGWVYRWFDDRRAPDTDLGTLHAQSAAMTPRNAFMKALPRDAGLIDLGAGNGGLCVTRAFPLLHRHDIRMYAFSLQNGAYFGEYQGVEIADFEDRLPEFPGARIDAIIAAHFIEHLKDPARAISFIAQRLAPGGRAYLEWPHPISTRMPRSTELQRRGIDLSTTRFDDDPSHISPWAMSHIAGLCADHGLQVESLGRIHLPFVGDALRDHGLARGDGPDITYGLWWRVGWPQYIVVAKPGI